MDPIGFGFEHFDAIGRYRDTEAIPVPGRRGGGGGFRGGPPPIQVDIDAQGEIAGIPDSNFSGAKELGTILADSPVCQKCIVRQMFRYSYGRLETTLTRRRSTSCTASSRARDSSFKSLWLRWCNRPSS